MLMAAGRAASVPFTSGRVELMARADFDFWASDAWRKERSGLYKVTVNGGVVTEVELVEV